MQTEKLTTKAQEALESARQLAHARSHQELDCDHLLYLTNANDELQANIGL